MRPRDGHVSVIAGMLPASRHGALQLSLHYDPGFSAEYLKLRAARLDEDGREVERREYICQALPLQSQPQDRFIYIDEMCSMMAPHLDADATLETIGEALVSMNQSWDFLRTFLALDSVVRPDRGVNVEGISEPDKSALFCDLSTQQINAILAGLRLYAAASRVGFEGYPEQIRLVATGLPDAPFSSVALSAEGAADLFCRLSRRHGYGEAEMARLGDSSGAPDCAARSARSE